VRDKKRPGQPNKFENFQLQGLLDENPAQTLLELSKGLNVTPKAASKRMLWERFIRKGYGYHINCQKMSF